mmetsp:Transcript_50582/g.101719  ORF Transcript_50582/g.101719 Transcript_50582/m.101719 type:complete len:99 (+) Transcript_50582:62-358(+)
MGKWCPCKLVTEERLSRLARRGRRRYLEQLKKNYPLVAQKLFECCGYDSLLDPVLPGVIALPFAGNLNDYIQDHLKKDGRGAPAPRRRRARDVRGRAS